MEDRCNGAGNKLCNSGNKPRNRGGIALRYRGLALLMTLMLTAMGSILALSGLNYALIDERIAGNQRQATLAFLAAEAGLLQAARWWDQPGTDGRSNHEIYWGFGQESPGQGSPGQESQGEISPGQGNSGEGVLALPGFGSGSLASGAEWRITTVEFSADSVHMTSRGWLPDTGATRTVSAFYRRPVPPPVLAPVTFAAPVQSVHWTGLVQTVDQSAFSGQSQPQESQFPENQAPAPWVLTASAADQALVAAALPPGLAALDPTPVAEKTIAALAPNHLQDWLTVLRHGVGVYVGPEPVSFGSLEHPKVIVIQTVDGHPVNWQAPSKLQGAGVLVVTGNLSLPLSLDYTGLILVLGQSAEISGPAGVLRGALVLQGIANPTAAEWQPTASEVKLAISAALTLHRNERVLRDWVNELPESARGFWRDLLDLDAPLGPGNLHGWRERLDWVS